MLAKTLERIPNLTNLAKEWRHLCNCLRLVIPIELIMYKVLNVPQWVS